MILGALPCRDPALLRRIATEAASSAYHFAQNFTPRQQTLVEEAVGGGSGGKRLTRVREGALPAPAARFPASARTS